MSFGRDGAEIYLLEDDPVVSLAVQRALADLGQVHASALWSELTQGLLRRPHDPMRPGLLICDLDLPGISGGDLCRIVRKHRPGLGILVFTGAPERAPTEACDGVVSKQQGVDALLAAARALVG